MAHAKKNLQTLVTWDAYSKKIHFMLRKS